MVNRLVDTGRKYGIKINIDQSQVIRLSRSKEPFTNYVRVPREWVVGKISTYSYFGGGSNWDSYVIFSKSIFYIRNNYFKSVIGLYIV